MRNHLQNVYGKLGVNGRARRCSAASTESLATGIFGKTLQATVTKKNEGKSCSILLLPPVRTV